MSILLVNNLKKTYISKFGGVKVDALNNISFSVENGEYVAIMGESGSGKTSLLNILAALDRPSSGEVYLNKENIVNISEKKLATFRRKNLGFVFQDFNLLDTFSVQDNILLPLVLAGMDFAQMDKLLQPLAQKLNISDLLKKFPYEISGGQKQRVAIARALITNPQMVLADEPTGALDSKSADGLLKIFDDINQQGQTILMVTHSARAASTAKRVLFIKDGVVFHQIYKAGSSREQMYQKIADTLTLISTGGSVDENAVIS